MRGLERIMWKDFSNKIKWSWIFFNKHVFLFREIFTLVFINWADTCPERFLFYNKHFKADDEIVDLACNLL